MLFVATSLGNPFLNGYHLVGRVAWFGAALEPFIILVGQKGFLDLF
jgi:hypothetical protein